MRQLIFAAAVLLLAGTARAVEYELPIEVEVHHIDSSFDTFSHGHGRESE